MTFHDFKFLLRKQFQNQQTYTKTAEKHDMTCFFMYSTILRKFNKNKHFEDILNKKPCNTGLFTMSKYVKCIFNIYKSD